MTIEKEISGLRKVLKQLEGIGYVIKLESDGTYAVKRGKYRLLSFPTEELAHRFSSALNNVIMTEITTLRNVITQIEDQWNGLQLSMSGSLKSGKQE